MVTLKLKTADFRSLTRRRTLPEPTQTARTVFAVARELLAAEATGGAYRLIGVALSDLVETGGPAAGFFPADEARARTTETAVDRLRAKFGAAAVVTGRALRSDRRDEPPGVSPGGAPASRRRP